MQFLLNLLYLAALLVLSPWLVWRSLRTGRYRQDLAAKLFGTSSTVEDSRPVVWFHGVSVGEIHLLVTVVKAFRQRFPNCRVVVSSTTDTGLAEARSKFPDLQVIPFPFDFSWAVRRTLHSLKPRLLVLAESEVWPNLLDVAHSQKVPVVVINGRVSPRSFKRWQQVKSLAARLIFPKVQLWAVQSQDYADRLLALGVPSDRVQVTGSVKYDGATGDKHTPKAEQLRQLFNLGDSGRSLVWVAGSTHSPEEQIVLKVFQELQPTFNNLKLILVPRHPDRFAEVASLIQQTGLNWKRRSELTAPVPELPSVLLLDSVGELGAVWALADVGYTGGSLDGVRGGQSMIEPAGYGVPTLFGPHVWNFRDAAQRLVEAGGAIQVREASELVMKLEHLLRDPALRQQMGTIARELVQAQQGATARTLEALSPFLEESPNKIRERE